MNKSRKNILITLAFLGITLIPTSIYAQTEGPSQPEFVQRQAPAGGNVSPYTGEFNYGLPLITVPGPGGSGQAITLSYTGAGSPHTDATMVGYGWQLGTGGAITRSVNGVADDIKQIALQINKRPPTQTVTTTSNAGVEAFSAAGLSLASVRRYTNYSGFYKGMVFTADVLGVASLDVDISEGQPSTNFKLSPLGAISGLYSLSTQIGAIPRIKNSYLSSAVNRAMSTGINHGNMWLHQNSSIPWSVMPFVGFGITLDNQVQGNPSILPAGLKGGVTGSYMIEAVLQQREVTHLGYLYSGEKNSISGPVVMDYHIEGEELKPNDLHLPLVIAGADNFMVGGTVFRANHTRVGTFQPTIAESQTVLDHIGLAANVPLNPAQLDLGIGTNVGQTTKTVSLGGWEHPGASEDYKFSTRYEKDPLSGKIHEGVYFSANESGKLLFKGNGTEVTDPVRLNLKVIDPSNLKMKVSLDETPSMPYSLTSAIAHAGGVIERAPRETVIDWNTSEDYINKPYRRFNRRADINTLVDRSTVPPESITEFCMYGAGGTKMIYGLPVYSRNESRLRYGVHVNTDKVVNNTLVYTDNVGIDNEKVNIVQGDILSYPIANSWLLTEQHSADYVDLTGDGPSLDDIGNYTQYNYFRTAGSVNKTESDPKDWYKWRSPYSGLNYHRNEMSNGVDDLGEVNYGEKELYWVESIQTKTHVAYFIYNTTDRVINGHKMKGSQAIRKDAYEAHKDESFISSKEGENWNPKEDDQNKNLRLEEIILFSRNTNGLPEKQVQRVVLKYDYTSWVGTPNAVQSKGKLTLRRVEFYNDAEGVNPMKKDHINGVEFYYEYPSNQVDKTNPNYIPGYPQTYNEFANKGKDKKEKPSYSIVDVDAWGNYQANGSQLANNLITWGNQDNPPAWYDPAAHYLKRIKFDSQAEQHIIYEPNDYAYVQDKLAMKMLPLTSSSVGFKMQAWQSSPEDFGNFENSRYYINLQEAGISEQNEIQAYKQQLYEHFIENNSPIYFKFLYQVLGEINAPEQININDCNNEYITGWVNVKHIGIENNKIYFQLGTWSSNAKDFMSNEEFVHPYKACHAFWEARKGQIKNNGECYQPVFQANENDQKGSVMNLLSQDFVKTFTLPISLLCDCQSFERSYLQVPIPKINSNVRVKGGSGPRVQALLMYDRGVSDTDQTLYGTVYQYTTEDKDGRKISSGVANNLPNAMSELNPLIQLDNSIKGSNVGPINFGKANKFVYGADLRQLTTFGKSIMGSATIGYSRVTTRSLYNYVCDNCKSSAGMIVTDYYTSKDTPYNQVFTKLEKQSLDHEKVEIPDIYGKFPTPAYSLFKNIRYTVGGNVITRFSLAGQVKKARTFGDDLTIPASTTTYEYFEPGDSIQVYNNGDITYDKDFGVKMERVSYTSSIKDKTIDVMAGIDINIGWQPPSPVVIPFPSFFIHVTESVNALNRHVTNTFVDYPVLLKKITTVADGINNKNYNIAFDAVTGESVVTFQPDVYDGLAIMGEAPKERGYFGIGYTGRDNGYPKFNNKVLNHGLIVESGQCGIQLSRNSNANQYWIEFSILDKEKASSSTCGGGVGENAICNIAGNFVSGDFLRIYSVDALGGVAHQEYGHVNKMQNGKLYYYPSELFWNQGNPPAGKIKDIKIEVLESGYTNTPSMTVGEMTLYGERLSANNDLNDRIIEGMSQQQKDDLTEFAQMLNSAINSLQAVNNKKTISYSNFPSQLQIYNNNGECVSMKEEIGHVEIIAIGTDQEPMIECRANLSPLPGNTAPKYLAIFAPLKNLNFSANTDAGRLTYTQFGECVPSLVNCPVFCPSFNKLDGVISASAIEMDNYLPIKQEYITSGNPYEINAAGFRVKSAYTYKTERTHHTDIDIKSIADAGILRDFSPFNFAQGAVNSPKWISPKGEVLSYNPLGYAEEIVDAMDIHHIYKYEKITSGIDAPFLVGDNMKYGEGQVANFERIEEENNQLFLADKIPFDQTKYTLVEGFAHTGKNSVRLIKNGDHAEFAFKGIAMTEKLLKEGLVSSLWVNMENQVADGLVCDFNLTIEVMGQVIHTVPFKKIARVDDWILYRATTGVINTQFLEEAILLPKITFDNLCAQTITIDDVRIQPQLSVLNTYVYDYTNGDYRVVAQLGNNNFGKKFIYTQNKNLSHVLAETADEGWIMTGYSFSNVPGLSPFKGE